MSDYFPRITNYYTELVKSLNPVSDVCIVAVAHMVPNALSFLPALNSFAKLALVLPKPKTTERPEYSTIKAQFKTEELSREWASDHQKVLATLKENDLSGQKLVIVDIGGYFSKSIRDIAAHYHGDFLGVLEGTENGLQKYEETVDQFGPTMPPIISVARSPLKLPEDFLVASSVVFSVEALLREKMAEILQTRVACVIGYGRVGSSIAHVLRGRGITTGVFDTDPAKLAEAAARGFQAFRTVEAALRGRTLVICATGNRSLGLSTFKLLEEGCVVASVTSADDEFDLSGVYDAYDAFDLVESSPGSVVKWKAKDIEENSFILLANGEAVNFVHGAVIGPAMQLIEGEKIAAIRALIDGEFVRLGKDGIYELHQDRRREVAAIWNKHFL